MTKSIFYKLQYIDSATLMARSLSNIVNNLLKEFIKLNANMHMIIENAKRMELNIKIVGVALKTQSLKMI